MASTAPRRPSKSTCTTCSMGMPKLASMVCTSWSGPVLYVALIRLYLPISLVSPATVTTVSRGIDSTLTWPVAGTMWTIFTTSLRWPPALDWFPKWAASAALSPTRESEPMSRTLNGCTDRGRLQVPDRHLWTWLNR